MAWIKTIDERDAKGVLARVYKGLIDRSGGVHNIFKVQSQSPLALKNCLTLHAAVMRGDSPLTPTQRELIAVVVSTANGCHY